MVNKGGSSLKSLVNRKETIYFILLLLASIPMYIMLFVSIVGIFVLGILVLIPIIAHLIYTAHIRTNGVRITENQFPEIFERTKEIAKEMGFYLLPDIYVMESGGFLNAFATRFFGRNMIVLYADLFEMKETDPKVVDFVIAHELAHIKRNHIIKNSLILPGNWIPFLGSAYSRACEYTCDRMANHYINDFEASTRALTMLAVGRKYYNTIDVQEYMHQSSREKGFFIWLSERLMSHPTLPKRISALFHFNNIENNIVFKTPKRVMAVGILAVSLAIGGVVIITLSADKLVSFVEEVSKEIAAEEEGFIETEINPDEETPLTLAVLDNDLKKAKKLIDEGADVNEKNDLGESPIIATTYLDTDYIDLDMLKLLLENGADPAIGDEEDYTVLHAAASMSDMEAIDLLLKYKADINIKDSYGQTPIFETVYEDNAVTFKHLVDKGANLMIVNDDGETLKDVAEYSGATEILKLLKK